MRQYSVQLERKGIPGPDYEHRRKAALRAMARLILRVESETECEQLETEALHPIVAEVEPELEKSA